MDRTYELQTDDNRIYGFIDGKKAVEQAIIKALNTERYEWSIYSDGYGSELNTLIGTTKTFACDEVERRITAALLQDERIEGVGDFSLQELNNGLLVSFTAFSKYGNIIVEKEVAV